MKFPARIIGFLLAFVLIFFITKSSFAQTPTTPIQPNSYVAPNTEANVQPGLHTYTQNVMLEVISAMTCQLVGIDPINTKQECLGVNPKTGKIGYVPSQGGALGFAIQGISMLYTPPLHTVDYVHYLSQNFGIPKPSYAQGLGLDQLNPLSGLWIIFRNLTYLFAVIVFVIIGLAIMLRVRIDPRTVMTIQNQIPKIIIALILITFSFAIAGLLVDLMYLSIYLIFSIFAGVLDPTTHQPIIAALAPINIQGKTVLDVANNLNVFNIAGNVSNAGKDTINGFLGVHSGSNILDNLLGAFNTLFTGVDYGVCQNSAGQAIPIANCHQSVMDKVYDFIGLVTGLKAAGAAAQVGPTFFGFNEAGTAAGLITGFAVFNGVEFILRDLVPYLIIFIIVMVALLITFFRVLYMLLISYVSVLLNVIFAPLWILGGLVPGSTTMGFGAWVRSIVSNLAVFPTVYAMFVLALIVGKTLENSNTGFAPPLLGNPLAGGFLGAITSLGLILMTPNAAKMVKAALKAPKLELGGTSFGAAAGLVATPFRKVSGGLFGKDAFGKSKIGSKLVGDRFGRLGQAFTGGGFRREGEDNDDAALRSISSRLRNNRIYRSFVGRQSPEGENNPPPTGRLRNSRIRNSPVGRKTGGLLKGMLVRPTEGPNWPDRITPQENTEEEIDDTTDNGGNNNNGGSTPPTAPPAGPANPPGGGGNQPPALQGTLLDKFGNPIRRS